MPVMQFRPHPWHGLDAGPEPPEILNAFIEITPFDLMKYEIDKVSGYLRVDRPQRSSAQHPERLQHYFLTYKLVPGRRAQAGVSGVYGRAHALKVVRAAMADYDAAFPAR